MAIEKTLNTRIQLKYDSLANWNANNAVVLKKGEVAFCAIESGSAVSGDLNRPQILFKVGDGTSTFAELPWASATAADVYAWAKQSTLPIVRASSETGDAGNVIASISWNASTNKVEYTTASVATAEGMKQVADDLDLLEAAVAAMYTNTKIDELVADAKKAGTDANTALETYKSSNDLAVADAKKAGTDAAKALNDYKTSNNQAINDINAAIEDIVDGTTTVTNATNALKATQDANGNNIASTYETKANAANYQSANDLRLDGIEQNIANITNADSGLLKTAKDYADQLNTAMDERVDALEAIDHSIYAESAKVVAKSEFETFKSSNELAIEDAEKNAKKYADSLKDAILGGEDLKDTFDTLLEIQNWIEGDGVNTTELTNAIATEAKTRGEEDAKLSGLIASEAGTRELADQGLATRIDNVINGTTSVAKATLADKATADAKGNDIEATYETKDAAATKLSTAKTYAEQMRDAAKSHADNIVASEAGTRELADSALDQRLSAVETLFNNGIAKEAAKVSNALTVKMEDATVKTFDGSEAITIDLTNLATDAQVETAATNALKSANANTASVVGLEAKAREDADKALSDRIDSLNGSHINTITTGTGLKATQSDNTYNIAFDDKVVFVFNCGTSTKFVD